MAAACLADENTRPQRVLNGRFISLEVTALIPTGGHGTSRRHDVRADSISCKMPAQVFEIMMRVADCQLIELESYLGFEFSMGSHYEESKPYDACIQ
jgi:hypothetical protein